MPDFAASLPVEAPFSAVIRYAADVDNMPAYLPTVLQAWKVDDDHIGMKVSIEGRKMEDTGFFRVTADRMEWGSEDKNYNGQLLAEERKGGCDVTLSLYIEPHDGNESEMWSARVKDGMRSALTAIKSHVERLERQRLDAEQDETL